MSETGEKIKEWLEKDGILQEVIDNPKLDFHYVVGYPAGTSYTSEILKRKDDDRIIVASSIRLSDRHYSALRALPDKERKAVIWQWRLDLLFRDADFRMLPSVEDVRAFEFSKVIYEDELNRGRLMSALKEIFKCKLYVTWRVAQLTDSELEGDTRIYR